jgi:hypothetical protein
VKANRAEGPIPSTSSTTNSLNRSGPILQFSISSTARLEFCSRFTLPICTLYLVYNLGSKFDFHTVNSNRSCQLIQGVKALSEDRHFHFPQQVKCHRPKCYCLTAGPRTMILAGKIPDCWDSDEFLATSISKPGMAYCPVSASDIGILF